MSNTSIKQLISNTVLKYDNTLASELNLLFENAEKYSSCSRLIYDLSPYTITGNNFDYQNYILRYSNLLPNIFRACWCDYDFLPLLNSCPIVDYTVVSLIYLPNIVDKDIVKGMIYYGLSDEIEFNKNIFKTMDERLKPFKRQMLSINGGQNYGQKYDILSIIFRIFNPHSMFVKFYTFVMNMTIIINRNGTGLTTPPYTIPWYTLLSCKCNNGIIDDTTKKNIINKVQLTTSDFININNLLVQNQNVNIILLIKYFKEVFNDVAQQIYCIIYNKKYCLQSYMLPSFVSDIQEKYNNYVINYESF
jgi:hypothetical protein